MISSLFGLGASIFGPKVFSFFNDQNIHVIHAMPGRIRLQCDRWKDKVVAQSLEKNLSDDALVKRVKATPVSGSLLLEFNVPHLTQEQFDKVLVQAVEAAVSAYPQMESQIMDKMRKTVQVVDGQIKKRTSALADLDSILVLLMLGKGISGFSKNPSFSSSLLFWAYNIITNRKEMDDDRYY
ncbi:hypothetical protein J2S74_004741 [Evansella vedderi]|uniref:Uncharacterized protein n=1 Tax=Evansella vedderi TaxID=38282 RepID=A0ABU0A1B8_9BACI|nr:hypothetical protein [Evansella vedderi]MDQ0257283.1 hypothetical protein [Evansella vedderi]